MEINWLVALLWIVYFLCLILIRIFTSSGVEKPFSFTIRFKVFIGVLILLHFVVYAFYIENLGVFKNDILIYPLLFVIGIILALIGIWFSGMAYFKSRKTDFNFVESKLGIFNKIRWPIYTGLMLIWFGVALIYNNWLGIIIGVFIFLPIIHLQVKLEEKNILKRFEEKGNGEAYRNYLKNTGLFFPYF